MERFSIRKLSELDVRKRYQFKISKCFADLENLDNREGINRIREISKRISESQLKKVFGLYDTGAA